MGHETIGPLLTRLRRERGWSQARVAEMLNDASGNPTLTRHEVSRWERERRFPNRYWLGWWATVFEVPLKSLERTAWMARRSRAGDGVGMVWGTDDTAALGASMAAPGALHPDAALRLADEWRTVEPLLVVLGELCQLAGRVASDAGLPAAAERHHLGGARPARAADGFALVANLLSSLACHGSNVGGRREAVPLATAARHCPRGLWLPGSRPGRPAGRRCRLCDRVVL